MYVCVQESDETLIEREIVTVTCVEVMGLLISLISTFLQTVKYHFVVVSMGVYVHLSLNVSNVQKSNRHCFLYSRKLPDS